MKVILKARNAGKTIELIKLSAKNGGYIICRSMEEASGIQKTAIKMGLSIPFPISWDEFIKKRYYAKGIKSFLIDNADDLLQELCKNIKLEAITLNGNDSN